MGFTNLKFQPGGILIEEGKPSDYVYLIKQGQVEIRKGSRRDHPIVLGRLGPGEIFGEMSVYDGSPSAAAAIAIDDTEVTAMSHQEFHRRFEQMDPIFKGIFSRLVTRVRDMSDKLAD